MAGRFRRTLPRREAASSARRGKWFDFTPALATGSCDRDLPSGLSVALAAGETLRLARLPGGKKVLGET